MIPVENPRLMRSWMWILLFVLLFGAATYRSQVVGGGGWRENIPFGLAMVALWGVVALVIQLWGRKSSGVSSQEADEPRPQP